MKKYLFCLSFLLFSVKFYSQEWKYLGENNIGDKFYIQNSSINPNSIDYPKVWSKRIVLNFIAQKNGKKLPIKNAIVKSLDSYDCTERRKRLVKILVYDAKENLITSHNYTEFTSGGEWNYVPPETGAEVELNYVCSNL